MESEELIVITPGEFNGSQTLFRIAIARCQAAHRHADEASARGGDIERWMRERDKVIETVVLVQAALEAHANWLFLQAGVEPSEFGWVRRWSALDEITRAMKRADKPELPDAHREFLEELSAWRNFIVHGDERSRTRLRKYLLNEYPALGVGEEVGLLDAAYASAVLARADAVCRWAQQLTGVQAPFTDGAWVAPDE